MIVDKKKWQTMHYLLFYISCCCNIGYFQIYWLRHLNYPKDTFLKFHLGFVRAWYIKEKVITSLIWLRWCYSMLEKERLSYFLDKNVAFVQKGVNLSKQHVFHRNTRSKIEKAPRDIREEESGKPHGKCRGKLYQQLEYMQVQDKGTERGVKNGKCSLLTCHNRRKCSMEMRRNILWRFTFYPINSWAKHVLEVFNIERNKSKWYKRF